MPSIYGGSVGNKAVGHATTPILFRCKVTDPVKQVGPDTFRVLRPTKSVFIVAVNEGDENYPPTNRWSTVNIPPVEAAPQSIEFPPLASMRVGGGVADVRRCKLIRISITGLPPTGSHRLGQNSSFN